MMKGLTWACLVGMSHLALSNLMLFPNDTLTASTTATLSTGCVTAMEAPLACDPYIQVLASQDYYGSMDNASLQNSLCEQDCGRSLSKYHSSVASACHSDPQPWSGIPATWYGDLVWASYNQTCLKDSKTGQYCNDYVSNITTSLKDDTDITDLPTDKLCSPCVIALFQHSQSTPFSNYDSGVAPQWSAVQSKCKVNYPTEAQQLVTNVTDSPGYATLNSSSSVTCLSGKQYGVKPGDDCQKIAASQSVSTGTLISINGLLPDCSDIVGGASLCLPQQCTVYLTKPNDNCYSIATAQGITFVQMLSYNPSINPSCTNLLSGTNVCVGQPGPTYNGTTITGATATQLSPYATTTAALPAGNLAQGTTTKCGKYHQVQSGEYCQLVALNNTISVELFTLINPSINAGCTNLVPALFYCVLPIQGWNATSSNVTTSATAIATPPASTPSGTTKNCHKYHVVISGDNCALLQSSTGITFSQLQQWNPSLKTDCSNLLLGEAYCVAGG